MNVDWRLVGLVALWLVLALLAVVVGAWADGGYA